MKGFFIFKLSLIVAEVQTKGYWDDSDLTIDRLLIEFNKCPKCKKRKLVYRGFSNPSQYVAFGVCEPCDLARRFWSEPIEEKAKRRLPKRAKSRLSDLAA